MIIYSMVQKTRAKTGAPIISAYKYFGFHFTLKRAGFFSRDWCDRIQRTPSAKKRKEDQLIFVLRHF